jgi:TRAP-type uncharacterized transport system fused permease subunit
MVVVMAVMVIVPVIMMMAMMVVLVMPVIRVAVIRHAAISMLHATVRQMRMVVIMTVDGERLGRLGAEEAHIFRALADGGRRSTAADMAVEADDRVCFCHDHMQVMRNQ